MPRENMRGITTIFIALVSVVTLVILISSHIRDAWTEGHNESSNRLSRDLKSTSGVQSINASLFLDAANGSAPSHSYYLDTTFTLDYVRTLISSDSGPILAKRQNSRELEAAVCKGVAIDADVFGGKHRDDTQWQTEDQLTENGWTLDDSEDQDFPEGLIGPYRALGLPTAMTESDPSGNVEVVAAQDEEFTNEFGKQKPTDADYWSVFNAEHGSLITVRAYSPSHRAQNDEGTLTPAQIQRLVPNVTRWSDVVWIQWAEYAGNKAGDLKYIWKDDIVTPLTQRIMQTVMGQAGRELHLPWPGKEFRMTDVKGLALLGTPSGAGVGWLLADHRDEITKVIEKVRIWTTPKEGEESLSQYYMLWFLEDP